MTEVQWVPLVDEQQLREAHRQQDDVIVRINHLDHEIRPLAMWWGLMVRDEPFLLAALRRGLIVELAQVNIREMI